MRILLSNDDGIYSPGLRALMDAVEDFGEVWVVAPDIEQSGVSHAFSLTGPLRVEQVQLDGCQRCYAVRGTPVDTVKLALREILPELPDMVISGINRGENSGVNILYSGTVSGAMEGAILGIPSIAVSVASYQKPNYGPAAEFTRKICPLVMDTILPIGTLVNINVPGVEVDEIKGVKITHQAESHYEEKIEKRLDPRSQEYYWIGGYNVLNHNSAGSDMEAVRKGFISITPIRVDQTDREFMQVMKGWNLD